MPAKHLLLAVLIGLSSADAAGVAKTKTARTPPTKVEALDYVGQLAAKLEPTRVVVYGRNLQISLRSLRVIRDLAVHRTLSIERSLLCLDAVVDELVPLAVQVDRAQVQHGLGALSFPTHSG